MSKSLTCRRRSKAVYLASQRIVRQRLGLALGVAALVSKGRWSRRGTATSVQWFGGNAGISLMDWSSFEIARSMIRYSTGY